MLSDTVTFSQTLQVVMGASRTSLHIFSALGLCVFPPPPSIDESRLSVTICCTSKCSFMGAGQVPGLGDFYKFLLRVGRTPQAFSMPAFITGGHCKEAGSACTPPNYRAESPTQDRGGTYVLKSRVPMGTPGSFTS